jgi:hypothetical protein
MRIDYATPIFELYPKFRMDIHWSMKNPFDYSTLQWDVENIEKPSQKELIEKSVEIYYQKEIEEYKGKRGGEYPTFADQFDQIFHDGVDAWKKTIRDIKDRHPKISFDPLELERRTSEALYFHGL